jgi:zinc and cadmium transporter
MPVNVNLSPTLNLDLPVSLLLWIVGSGACIGAITVAIAAAAALKLKAKTLERMVSFSIGLMLATSLLHALPEALNATTTSTDTNTAVSLNAESLCATLLGSILGFFLLQKMALMRHNHHHEHDGHHHHHGHDAHMAGSGGWLIVLGSSVHNFTDGIVIAAAFIADIRLGLLTALSIAAHEVPHKLGDFVVMLNAGFSKRRAILMDLLSSATMMLGGLLGWWLLGSMQSCVPYMLMVAAGSFIYIAMSDLIPYVQHESRVRDVVPQVSLIALGVFFVWALHHFEPT